MVLRNIIRYKKRSFKIMFIFLAIVFATLSFFFIKTGYKNLYEDIGSINQGKYYIKAKTTEEIPVLTSNVELIVCYGENSSYIPSHYFLNGVDLGIKRYPNFLIFDFNNLPDFLGFPAVNLLLCQEIFPRSQQTIILY